MLRGWLAVGLIAPMLLAGCIGSDDDPVAGQSIDADALGALLTGTPSAAELAARSVDAPADWRVGEWWRFEVDAPLTGDTYEATVVLGGEKDGALMLGMPADEFDDAATVIHIPPTGPMTIDTMSWYFHSHDFPMAPFPLTPGKSWGFHWVGADATAEVVDVGEGIAMIEVLHPTAQISYTYDAALGFFSAFDWAGVVSWKVVDHGFAFKGKVLVPDDPYLAIFHGRLAGVVNPLNGLAPGAPIEQITVEDRDTMSLGFILGQFGLPGAGVYRAGATAPDGTMYSDEHVSVERPTVLRAVRVENPGGTWALDYEALGPGVAIVEAVAFNSVYYDL